MKIIFNVIIIYIKKYIRFLFIIIKFDKVFRLIYKIFKLNNIKITFNKKYI